MAFKVSKDRITVNRVGIFCGGISALLTLLCRLAFSEQASLFLRSDIACIVPPVWILNFMSLIFSLLIGYVAGTVICLVSEGRTGVSGEIQAYRGGLLFVALIFCELIRHPLFFASGKAFFAFLITLFSIFLAVGVACFWSRIALAASVIACSYALWLFYLAAIELAVSLHI